MAENRVVYGLAISTEEHPPDECVRHARRAEEAGLAFVSVTDHYHPWIGAQAQASFAWSVLGAIAATTERIQIGTGVTCPLVRMHPAVAAQAAVTTAAMCDGRFWFGFSPCRRPRRPVPIPSLCWSRYARTSTRVSTTSISTRSALTRKGSSGSGSANSRRPWLLGRLPNRPRPNSQAAFGRRVEPRWI